jgi:hypothetical protein
MKNSMRHKDVVWRKDPNQRKVLVWSDLDAVLNEERPARGQKCPMFTF